MQKPGSLLKEKSAYIQPFIRSQAKRTDIIQVNSPNRKGPKKNKYASYGSTDDEQPIEI